MYWPRGRVWGGSSALNAMVYIRGHAYDYDGWEAAGAKGWSYADCLPYFKKSQTHELGTFYHTHFYDDNISKLYKVGIFQANPDFVEIYFLQRVNYTSIADKS